MKKIKVELNNKELSKDELVYILNYVWNRISERDTEENDTITLNDIAIMLIASIDEIISMANSIDDEKWNKMNELFMDKINNSQIVNDLIDATEKEQQKGLN